MSLDTRTERRERMLSKVRKLLAMGQDGRGNANEAETAMRQAAILMAEYNIAEADLSLHEILSGFKFGTAPVSLSAYRIVPSWAGVLGLGVAIFTDTQCRYADDRLSLRLSGEREDVLFAQWLFKVLAEQICREAALSGLAKKDHDPFCQSAAVIVQRRLKAMHKEQQPLYTGTNALVVIDAKHKELIARFGTQPVGRASSTSGLAGALGSAAGHRTNIPSNRPIGAETRQSRLLTQ